MFLAAAATLVPQSGCSFVFVDRPSAYKSGETQACTTSYDLPVLDAGFALLYAVSIAIMASASGNSYGGEGNRTMVTTVGLTWLIMHAGSAGFGFSWVGECKELVPDSGFGTRPVRPAPRPRPLPTAPPADASPPQPTPLPQAEPRAAD
jgi:hypothetical protein